jgi:hypothetical protein
MLLTSQANYPQSRTFTACRQHFLTDIRQRCSNHSNITFQLRSASATDQPIQFDLIFIEFTFVGKLEMEIGKLTIVYLISFLPVPDMGQIFRDPTRVGH